MAKKVPIIIATIRTWNISRAKKWTPPAGFRTILITKKEDLTPERVAKIGPRYIFFPHWSWIIPKGIHEKYECIVFHMTDLPFGRGGSPLQNLLSRGIYRTKVSAIRVADGIDTGDVYMKHPLGIAQGSAHDIYEKLSQISFSMMTSILKKHPMPRPQSGTPVIFPRRTPAQSEIPPGLTVRQLYDFIRMLDAPEYPHAFMRVGDVKIEFTSARIKKGEVTADVNAKEDAGV